MGDHLYRFGIFATALALLILAGCSSVSQKLDPKMFYKRDIVIEVNGRQFEGVTTIPKASSYFIRLKPKGNIGLALMRSCAREDSSEGKTAGFFNFAGKKEFTYNYTPNPGLEDMGVCPLRVDVYESSKKGRHSWALLDFEHQDYQMPFQVDCNGRRKGFNGVGTCQARNGLIQRLHFEGPVRFADPQPEKCSKPTKHGDYVYEINVTLGECLYHFDTIDGILGRLTVVGYEGILVREVQ